MAKNGAESLAEPAWSVGQQEREARIRQQDHEDRLIHQKDHRLADALLQQHPTLSRQYLAARSATAATENAFTAAHYDTVAARSEADAASAAVQDDVLRQRTLQQQAARLREQAASHHFRAAIFRQDAAAHSRPAPANQTNPTAVYRKAMAQYQEANTRYHNLQQATAAHAKLR